MLGGLLDILLGAMQDHSLDRTLAKQNPALHAKVAQPALSRFGLTYQSLDKERIAALPQNDRAEVEQIVAVNNQSTLAKVAVLPAIMFLCYLGLLLYFKSRGGYGQVQLSVLQPGVTGD
jgi:hypothetical protein